MQKLQKVKRFYFLFILSFLLFVPDVPAQTANKVKENYTKYEYSIPMRDGAKLFTVVYAPKDHSKKYPLLLTRTPYSVSPYPIDQYRTSLGPSPEFEKEKFIFVYQDARGRYMSEGKFRQVRPHIPDKKSKKDVDESSDAYDTIDWLLKNIANNNGKVGMIGISQPGFHVAASMIDSHPALKCASPQAPTADYYLGDDVYHNGAFMLAANFGFYSFFQARQDGPTVPKQRRWFDPGTADGYDFFLNLGPLSEVNQKLFAGKATYFQEIVDHTNYDEFWQKRSLWKFMDHVNCAVLNVGGWFDAEDPAGPLYIYRSVEKKNPGTENLIVMGPWRHGGWAHGDGSKLGNVDFGVKTAVFFREKIQFPFFMKHLKDKNVVLPEAYMFLTGINEWRAKSEWPPKNAKPVTFYLREKGSLSKKADQKHQNLFDDYVSDPLHPVPYVNYITRRMSATYVTDDQRFAAQRPDVLVYRTEPLTDDFIIAGPISVNLYVATTGTDADFVVKVIDVYPDDYPAPAAAAGQHPLPTAVKMGGYQQLIRGEPFRGKFRQSFEKPEPFVPGQPEQIKFKIPDMYHAFRKGHRIMVQIQSSWFPLVDRNPQKFMKIPEATASDFMKANQKIFRSGNKSSAITFLVE